MYVHVLCERYMYVCRGVIRGGGCLGTRHPFYPRRECGAPLWSTLFQIARNLFSYCLYPIFSNFNLLIRRWIRLPQSQRMSLCLKFLRSKIYIFPPCHLFFSNRLFHHQHFLAHPEIEMTDTAALRLQAVNEKKAK